MEEETKEEIKETTSSGLTFWRDLECTLTEKETLAYSKDLTRLIQEKTGLEDKKKEITSEMNARIQKKAAEINELAVKVSNGHELRRTKVYWFYWWPEGIKDLVRFDNGETIKKGELIEQWERQEKLFEEKEAGQTEELPPEGKERQED